MCLYVLCLHVCVCVSKLCSCVPVCARQNCTHEWRTEADPVVFLQSWPPYSHWIWSTGFWLGLAREFPGPACLHTLGAEVTDVHPYVWLCLLHLCLDCEHLGIMSRLCGFSLSNLAQDIPGHYDMKPNYCNTNSADSFHPGLRQRTELLLASISCKRSSPASPGQEIVTRTKLLYPLYFSWRYDIDVIGILLTVCSILLMNLIDCEAFAMLAWGST